MKILSSTRYGLALDVIDELWDAIPGTPEADFLLELVDAVEKYESEHEFEYSFNT